MLQYEGMLARQETIDALSKTLRANEMTDGVHIRLTVTRGLKYTSGLEPRVNVRGCSLIILAEHKPPVYKRSSIRLATVRQRRLFADEVFCTGRMGEIIAVTQVDETRFNLGRSGQVTIRISQLYQELTQAEGYAILG